MECLLYNKAYGHYINLYAIESFVYDKTDDGRQYIEFYYNMVDGNHEESYTIYSDEEGFSKLETWIQERIL